MPIGNYTFINTLPYDPNTAPSIPVGYKTMDEAALAWAMAYNPYALNDLDNERASALYQKDGLYWFTNPISGKYITNDKGIFYETPAPRAPSGNQASGYIHSHFPNGSYTEVYSDNDLIAFAIKNQSGYGNRPQYLVTPGGTLQILDKRWWGIQHEELCRDIPGDLSYLSYFIHFRNYRETFPEVYTNTNTFLY